MTRYYLNNFQDGAKQDAIDFVTGNYTVKKGAAAASFNAFMRANAFQKLQGGLLQNSMSSAHTGPCLLHRNSPSRPAWARSPGSCGLISKTSRV